MTGLLVLVTGAGRSGTSTIAGTLHHLGLSVPGPYLGANPSNPKGFFESRWALKFHKRIEKAARIQDFDSQPQAFERARAAVTPELRSRLVTFLGRHAGDDVQVVVKDPRSIWVQQLWKEAAAEVGLNIGYLSMLRDPAEVVGSRTTYYAQGADEEQRRNYEICQVARWVNVSLGSERETRGERRTFVVYRDLLADWRPALARVSDALGLTFNTDLTRGEPHAVDEFIDPALHRLQVTWADLQVPEALQEIAQQTWVSLLKLHDSGGSDEATSHVLDDLSIRYADLYSDARAIVHDAMDAIHESGRHAGELEARKKVGQSGRPRSTRRRAVDEASGRELARALGARVASRLRRG